MYLNHYITSERNIRQERERKERKNYLTLEYYRTEKKKKKNQKEFVCF